MRAGSPPQPIGAHRHIAVARGGAPQIDREGEGRQAAAMSGERAIADGHLGARARATRQRSKDDDDGGDDGDDSRDEPDYMSGGV